MSYSMALLCSYFQRLTPLQLYVTSWLSDYYLLGQRTTYTCRVLKRHLLSSSIFLLDFWICHFAKRDFLAIVEVFVSFSFITNYTHLNIF